jgi:6-phosphogluconolactonase (cycloisomerase 2 family)
MSHYRNKLTLTSFQYAAYAALLLSGLLYESRANEETDPSTGAVFAMTNRARSNAVVAFRRDNDGMLAREARYPTLGNGQGVDFDTQGGLTLSSDNRYLYACNPGSDNVTVFKVKGSTLRLVQLVPAGDQPTSITLSGGFAYVLDSSVAGNGITGFSVAQNGRLTPLPGSFRALSSPIAVPGEVRFSPNGKFLVVTHKVGSVIDVFQVAADGLASTVPTPYPSAGPRPFALDFRNDGRLLVVESGLPAMANTGVSSYNMEPNSGALALLRGRQRTARPMAVGLSSPTIRSMPTQQTSSTERSPVICSEQRTAPLP